MKKGLQIHIPAPCHEDRQQMTPVDKGRFCQSCAKQVVDFSVMTDQQILTYLSKAAGNLCGRFADDQLQRPLLPVKEEKKKVWWIAAMMPLLLLFEKSSAEKKKMWQGTPAVHTKKAVSTVRGRMQSSVVTTGPRAIYGKVLNANGQPVQFASITINGEYSGINADSTGLFSILLLQKNTGDVLEVSAVGYETQSIYIANDKNEYIISLKQSENNLPPFVATSYDLKRCTVTTGGAIAARTLSWTIRDSIRQLLTIPAFKVFPNPIPKGTAINITVKNKGSYSIQLFDNNGKLMLVQDIEAAEDATQASVNIPPSLAAGMYYVRLVNDKKKKQYTDKIIVM